MATKTKPSADVNQTAEAVVATVEPKKDVSVIVIRDDAGMAIGVKFAFRNGKILGVDRADMTPRMDAEAWAHGVKQKVVDAAAKPRDTANGKSATVDEKYEACEEVALRIVGENGQWNAEREGGVNVGGYLARALVELNGGTIEQAKTYLETLTGKQRDGLAANPKVDELIKGYRAAKVADIDTEALLSGYKAA